jgi:CRISPR/Cas system-associated endonuclease Cas1
MNTSPRKTSLREIIDDILLLARNSNISESEDFSRSHIAAWVNHYRRKLWKDHIDQLKEQEKAGAALEDLVDGEFILLKETGPHKL